MAKPNEGTAEFEVRLPELGEGIVSATVAGWAVQEGAWVQAEEEIVDLVTDKATFSVPAGKAGVVGHIFFKNGEDVRVGATLAVIKVKR